MDAHSVALPEDVQTEVTTDRYGDITVAFRSNAKTLGFLLPSSQVGPRAAVDLLHKLAIAVAELGYDDEIESTLATLRGAA